MFQLAIILYPEFLALLASLPRRFLANGSKPKHAQIKEGIKFSGNNIRKYITNKMITGLSVTQKVLICTKPNILYKILWWIFL
jgi:hypothetical protein